MKQSTRRVWQDMKQQFSKFTCILCQDHRQSFLTISTSRTFLTKKTGNIHQLRQFDYSFLVNSMKEQCQIAFRHRNELGGLNKKNLSFTDLVTFSLQCRGCEVCLLCIHFATYTPTACLLFQKVLGKGFTLPRHEVSVFRARNEKSYPVADQEE